MQRTRLNTLLTLTGMRFSQFFSNPWRRISLVLLSLFFGFFIGAAISTTSGQDAQWDVVGAALILIFSELINRWVYSQSLGVGRQRLLVVELLNTFKIGVIYSLFLEAFKLGS